MTIDEYYAAVHNMRLRKTAHTTVWVMPDRETFRTVSDPTNLTPDQRRETIERLEESLSLYRDK